MTTNHQTGSPLVKKDLANLDVSKFDCVMVLCDEKWMDPDENMTNGYDDINTQGDLLRLESVVRSWPPSSTARNSADESGGHRDCHSFVQCMDVWIRLPQETNGLFHRSSCMRTTFAKVQAICFSWRALLRCTFGVVQCTCNCSMYWADMVGYGCTGSNSTAEHQNAAAIGRKGREHSG